MLDYSY